MWYEECPSEADCAPAPTTPCPANPNGEKSASSSSATTNAKSSVSKAGSTPANQFIDLPHNFYWAIPGKVIGMACPTRRRHVENLQQHHKVSMMVNLRECATSQQLFEGLPVKNVHIPIRSFDVPTIGQVQQFIRLLDEVLEPDPKTEGPDKERHSPSESGHADKEETNERSDCINGTQYSNVDAGRCNDCDSEIFAANASAKKRKARRNRCSLHLLCKTEDGENMDLDFNIEEHSKQRKKKKKNKQKPLASRHTVAINCRWGKGRTGTMICCYIVHSEGISANDAIRRVRTLSPGSLETKGQEEFVEEFYRLKMVADGKEAEYQRSLPYPHVPEHHNHRTNPQPLVSPANVTYGRHEPGATQAYAKKAAITANSGKICWNNSLLISKMYK